MGFAEDFVGGLAGLQFKDAFNPYADLCPVYDLPDAPALRRGALTATINQAQRQGVHSLWIGLAPGHRGARRTGLAFTDDITLPRHSARWGIELERPTKGKAISESTAKTVWEELSRIEETVFLWNIFPLHPHEPDNPFSNRDLCPHERSTGRALLAELISALNPMRLVAVGNEADNAVRKVAPGREVVKVRHPSYGGKTKFSEAIRRLYR